ncbi:MAG: endonuclease domain-containing protein [Hyphomicrobiales bacterium]|nr:endonuclease domain-containing protein [Hyphomicrobiales bacterium]MBV8663612.1 endonuclease domain-containing protein [Hyphomicrobiales bacterium]
MLRFARQQRANAVNAETLIWREVRNRRCLGAKFQRQVPLGNFIVDFICFERRLIVEIDGPSHQSDAAARSDAGRDAWLEQEGFRVLRLPNDLVIGSPPLAVARIRSALGG